MRVIDKSKRRIAAIDRYYDSKKSNIKKYAVMQHFIKDILKPIDLDTITKIARPEAYYKFQQVQLQTNLRGNLGSEELEEIDRLMIESKTGDPQDIEKGKFKYRIYPSSRMFGTFNVWGDMLNGRLPNNMSLAQWIFWSLIIDLIAFLLRILAAN